MHNRSTEGNQDPW